ncbi:tam domain protein [Grosmannia clavigera kw1407]|uniref:Tam domain protein n=1 Tax=Grosmannia clavigera (strain kw1407 / UAMH 11150) TaxID=655863 RepID=F0XGL6_GROCL|nr:tam domain protein [Grosmannia clavigera kw1407]EFX02704.1 tam domain protein [Grosmannia clavigera kw1407]
MEGSSSSPARNSDSETGSFEFTFHRYLDVSARIEADINPGDHPNPDSASLTESVFNYHNENGRTYHAYRAGSYYYPNDEAELERLENLYDLIRLVLDGRNYLAPWSQQNPPKKVLDLATGSGRWAVEMGDEFPTAEIVGIDLSPIQPTIVPPNVNFFVEDATEDWQETGVDYVHTRVTVGCWSDVYTEVIAQAFAKLEPGGWLEMQEVDGTVYCDDGTMAENSPISVWSKELYEASLHANRPLAVVKKLKGWLEDAGFVDVQEKAYKLPTSGWPRNRRLKEIGELWQANLQMGLAAISYALMHRVMGRTKEQIEVSLVNVRKEVANQRSHTYHCFHVVWGRKPNVDEMRTEATSAGTAATRV